MKNKTSFRVGVPKTKLITNDAKVRSMAKKAGVWEALRAARQQGQACLVLSGMVIFGAYVDGFVALVCSSPSVFLESFVRLSLGFGIHSAYISHGVMLH